MCNSGVPGPTVPLWDVSPDDWEVAFRVNVTGTFLTCRACLPHMLERKNGSIVVIGSMTGKRPLYGRTPYTSSKMALVGLVRTLAVEAGPFGVRVNLVSPGPTEGPRIARVFERQAAARGVSVEHVRADMIRDAALRRLTHAREVADDVVFLGSAAASAVTGEDLNVSAGAVMY